MKNKENGEKNKMTIDALWDALVFCGALASLSMIFVLHLINAPHATLVSVFLMAHVVDTLGVKVS